MLRQMLKQETARIERLMADQDSMYWKGVAAPEMQRLYRECVRIADGATTLDASDRHEKFILHDKFPDHDREFAEFVRLKSCGVTFEQIKQAFLKPKPKKKGRAA